MLTAQDRKLLQQIADLKEDPPGAYNIRKDGQGILRRSLPGINVIPKKDKPGIDIIVEEGRSGTVHIPVIMTVTGQKDLVYNTIDIGPGAKIELIAGCGIHNPGHGEMRHDGIHEIFVRRGARLRYSEKHYGAGEGRGKRILNPKTILVIEEEGYAELELVQIRGVDDTIRETEARVEAGGRLEIYERMLTDGEQSARSDMVVRLSGGDASARIISRSVGQGNSKQVFQPRLVGCGKCRGHVECDSIIMDKAVIRSIPEIWAESSEAELVHEAAIGKIAGEQIIKLMTLGLTREEAEESIITGFLK
ncbi:MAG TPA: SufD family Fe-S cluster assembly protein [Firmicutes bacterium]|nr:SufD family Fe-S cluster assembly protein [Bacillota bacterium]